MSDQQHTQDSVIADLKAQIQTIQRERDAARGQLEADRAQRLADAFAASSFVRSHTTIAPEAIHKLFGDRFYFDESSKIRAKGSDGNVLYSPVASPGSPADFEEAIQLLVESSPYADTLLKTSIPSAPGPDGKKPTMARKEFDRLPPGKQREAALTCRIID